jgi:hypothetical protein
VKTYSHVYYDSQAGDHRGCVRVCENRDELANPRRLGALSPNEAYEVYLRRFKALLDCTHTALCGYRRSPPWGSDESESPPDEGGGFVREDEDSFDLTDQPDLKNEDGCDSSRDGCYHRPDASGKDRYVSGSLIVTQDELGFQVEDTRERKTYRVQLIRGKYVGGCNWETEILPLPSSGSRTGAHVQSLVVRQASHEEMAWNALKLETIGVQHGILIKVTASQIDQPRKSMRFKFKLVGEFSKTFISQLFRGLKRRLVFGFSASPHVSIPKANQTPFFDSSKDHIVK